MARLRVLLLAVVALLCATGCGTGAVKTKAAQKPPPSGRPAQACGSADRPQTVLHVVWIVMENKAFDEVIGSPQAPYTSALAARCGLARGFVAETHPSLPNYIAMTSGDPQGVTDDAGPEVHRLRARSLFGALGPTGWRALQDGMPGACARASHGRYLVRHNAAVYYDDARSACPRQDVPLGRGPDLSAPFTFVTPDACHDTHDCGVAAGDRWLSGFMGGVLQSPEYRDGRTVVFITYDEGEGSSNRIPTLVVAPWVRPGTASAARFDHYSLLRTTQELLGARPLLGRAATAASMRPAFGL